MASASWRQLFCPPARWCQETQKCHFLRFCDVTRAVYKTWEALITHEWWKNNHKHRWNRIIGQCLESPSARHYAHFGNTEIMQKQSEMLSQGKVYSWASSARPSKAREQPQSMTQITFEEYVCHHKHEECNGMQTNSKICHDLHQEIKNATDTIANENDGKVNNPLQHLGCVKEVHNRLEDVSQMFLAALRTGWKSGSRSQVTNLNNPEFVDWIPLKCTMCSMYVFVVVLKPLFVNIFIYLWVNFTTLEPHP